MSLLLLACLGQESSPEAVECFRRKMAAAKSVHEKALAIRELGEARDPASVPALARYLAPQAGDRNGLLVTTAAESLGRFRGSVGASRVLMGAAEASRRNPYLHARLVEAVTRVGHESGLALFEEALRGPESASAVRSIAAFPPSVAVEALLVEGRKLERKVGENGDRLRSELLQGLQRLSGEKYPSLVEFELWWKKRGASFRLQAQAREKASPPGPSGRHFGPVLLVELSFREGGGMLTSNTGASAGACPVVALGNGAPAWTGQAAINAGPSALEWGKEGGAQAVELGVVENLKGLKSFTLSGWMLRTDPRETPGSFQRVLTWLAPTKTGEGVDLAVRSDGRLQLGLNQPAEASTLASPPGQFPILDAKAMDAGAAALAAWRWFAVSYDSTASSDPLKFYAGGWNDDVRLVGKATVAGAAAGSKIAPLTIGNAAAPFRAGGGRAFRGVLDEIRIHGSEIDGSGALGLEALIKLQNRQPPTP